MNILVVNTYHYLRGGDCRHALETADMLHSAGHGVVPFAMAHARNLQTPFESYFADEVDYPRLMAAGGLRNALRVVATSIYNRQARRRLATLLDDHPVQLAHLHSVMHHLTAAVVLELYHRHVPVVWTLHDLKSVCPTTRMLRAGQVCEQCRGGQFHRALATRCKRGKFTASAIVTAELYLHRAWKVYERARVLIAPSRFLRDKVLEHGLKPARIEVLPNPVDLGAYAPTRDDAGYVLYVGRLDPEKGVATLLRAAAAARVPLKIAGTGELSDELRGLAASLPAADVEFLGHCGASQLRAAYAGARAIAVPSEWYENCPYVVLEAFASGKPVLGSNLGGLPELIQEACTGWLLPPRDVDSWARALSHVASDPTQCHRMGREARSFVEQRHAPAAHMSRLLELYEEAMAGRA